MFSVAWNWIKTHPLWTAGGVLAVIIVVWFLTRPKTGQAITIMGPDDGDAVGMAQMQALQGQLAVAHEKLTGDLQLGLATIGRDKYIAELAAQTSGKQLDLQKDVAMGQISSANLMAQLQTTLAGQQITSANYQFNLQTQAALKAAELNAVNQRTISIRSAELEAYNQRVRDQLQSQDQRYVLGMIAQLLHQHPQAV